jgi:hypothetical protein
MLRARHMYRYVVVIILVLTIQVLGVEFSATEAVEAMANRLERSQIQEGPEMGAWPDEGLFAGPATAGMVCAHDWTGSPIYEMTARSGGYYILRTSDVQGSLLGDEAYAFLRLSEMRTAKGLVAYNVWRGALAEFYDSVRRPGYEGSTPAYLAFYDDQEPATVVFYLAYHVIAAYYVNDQDKQLWRDGLIRHLSRVDDDSSFPVMALGAATWALATIDALDDTPVAPDGGSPQWDGVVLADLPALLLSHQVGEGEPFAGSFYWRFDHTSGNSEGVSAGYTEDAISGVLGLVAAASLEDIAIKEDLEQGIAAGQQALLLGIDAEGAVYEHLSGEGQTYHAFAGEMLQALWSVRHYTDTTSAVPAQE